MGEPSGKKKAHKHKLFGPVALGTTPGRDCPRDKPDLSFSPCFTQWNPSLSQDKPSYEGRHKSLCVKNLCAFLCLTFPKAKLRRHIFMTGRISGRRIGRKNGRNFGRIFLAFSCFMCCAERITKISSQIPPNLSLHVLSRLMWLKSQNFISASFWGLGRLCPFFRSGEYQRQIKGQQLKGKIVSEIFTLFHKFHAFYNFCPGLSPSKQRVSAQGEQKRRKDNKKNRTNRCCTLVVARLSSF